LFQPIYLNRPSVFVIVVMGVKIKASRIYRSKGPAFTQAKTTIIFFAVYLSAYSNPLCIKYRIGSSFQ